LDQNKCQEIERSEEDKQGKAEVDHYFISRLPQVGQLELSTIWYFAIHRERRDNVGMQDKLMYNLNKVVRFAARPDTQFVTASIKARP